MTISPPVLLLLLILLLLLVLVLLLPSRLLPRPPRCASPTAPPPLSTRGNAPRRAARPADPDPGVIRWPPRARLPPTAPPPSVFTRRRLALGVLALPGGFGPLSPVAVGEVAGSIPPGDVAATSPSTWYCEGPLHASGRQPRPPFLPLQSKLS